MSMMRGGVMRSQHGSGNAEFKEPASFDSHLWADRPAADAYNGRIIRVTDVGPSAGSLFISDGTYWAPLNGSVVLYAGAELGLSTTATSAALMGGWSMTIPAGLFQKPGSHLRGIIKGRRTGTLGTDGFPTIRLGWGTTAGAYVVGASATGGANDSLRGHGTISRVNDTQIRAYGVGNNLGGIPSTDTWESALYTLSATADLTLGVYGNTAATPGAGEAMNVDEIILELIVP